MSDKAQNKPKILIVSRNFPPLVGGIERFLLNAVRQLHSEFQCDVIAPEGCEKSLNALQQGFACRVSSIPRFLFCALWTTLRKASSYQLLIAGSGVTAPIVVIAGKLFKKPSIVFVYGLDLIAANTVYQWLFVPFIRHADTVITISHNTAALARKKGVKNIEILFPGVDIPETQPDANLFLQQYTLQNKTILLAVGRIIPRKGLAEFVEHCLSNLIKTCPDIVLVVIGDTPHQALQKNSNYMQQLQASIARQKLESYVHFIGTVDDEALHNAYAAAQVFIFPLRPVSGDVEGFGMVAVEAAAHGLPVVAFAEGGVTDAVSDQVSGKLVKSGDYAAFNQAILDILNSDEINADNCKTFAKQFSWENFGQNLRRYCANTIAAFKQTTKQK